MDQRRGHHQELPRHVQVHLLHQVDVLDVLRRDERDGNVVDAQLVPLDQVQQQVERPLEVHQADRERLENGLEFLFHYTYLNFTASRTRSIVCSATTRAFFEPSCRISFTRARLREHLGAARADRIEIGVQRLRQLGLDLDVADLAGAVALLQIVDFRRVRD